MTNGTLPNSADQPEGCKLEHKTIGNLRGKFFVPGYQRGYRWGQEDVRRLLDDIWESGGREYSLQPVVLKLHVPGDSEEFHEWELIDGQQRLTTLYVIFRYIQQQEWRKSGAPFALRYDTRPGSGTYLQGLGADPDSDATLAGGNIDFHHLFHAYQAVHSWFVGKAATEDRRENVASTLSQALYTSVRVIWYEAPPSTVATELFTRLNVGRIPLTDAELVKAALLSKIRSIASNGRAEEIAAQWDNIERDLHRSDIWAFVSGLASNADDVKYPTRISLLLDTLADQIAGPPAGKRPRYYTFDQVRANVEQDPTSFWNRVLAQHAQVIGWFGHVTLYNKIGFLVACSNDSAAEFGRISLAALGKKKSEFEAHLDDCIRSVINTTDEELTEPKYDEVQGYRTLMKLLLLINVEAVSRAKQHFPFARHVGERWSLEHIHAQNAETLNKAEQWRAWLEAHGSALDAVLAVDNADTISKLKNDINASIMHIQNENSKAFSRTEFRELSMKVLKFLDRDSGADHSIRNMALLSSEHNSKLSNAVFEVKRQRILALDRAGEYVPACTRNVFLKYYADADAQQPHFWSDKDKDAYLEAIRSLLRAYLKEGDR